MNLSCVPSSKTLLIKLALSLVLAFTVSSCCSTNDSEKNTTVLLSKVMQELNPYLLRFSNEANTKGFKVDSLIITLQTSTTVDTNGKVELVVLSAGGSRSNTLSSTFKVTMKDIEGSSPTNSEIDQFFGTLSGILDASNQNLGNLATSTIQGTIKFSVESKIEAGIADLEIKPISISAGGSNKNTYMHQIEINLTKVKDNGGAL